MPRVHVPESHAADPSAYVWSQYAPEIAGGAGSYIQAVYTKSLMSLRELEAARMRTAQINGCALCLGMRSARDLAGYLANSGVDPMQAVSARGDPAPDEQFYAEICAEPNWSGFSARDSTSTLDGAESESVVTNPPKKVVLGKCKRGTLVALLEVEMSAGGDEHRFNLVDYVRVCCK
jgi:hypothetical protein